MFALILLVVTSIVVLWTVFLFAYLEDDGFL